MNVFRMQSKYVFMGMCILHINASAIVRPMIAQHGLVSFFVFCDRICLYERLTQISCVYVSPNAFKI